MADQPAPDVLPEIPERLASVFRSLRNGRHISRNDGADFHDLERRTTLYEHLLRGLGYTLRSHNQGFYYLEGSGTLRSDRMRKAMLFLLILFQSLEEGKMERQDRAWEKSLLRASFKVSELPHFQTPLRRGLMSQVDVDESKVADVLSSLKQLGVVRTLSDGQFGFLPPVYRFVDLCMKYAEDANWADRASAPTATAVAEQDDPEADA